MEVQFRDGAICRLFNFRADTVHKHTFAFFRGVEHYSILDNIYIYTCQCGLRRYGIQTHLPLYRTHTSSSVQQTFLLRFQKITKKNQTPKNKKGGYKDLKKKRKGKEMCSIMLCNGYREGRVSVCRFKLLRMDLHPHPHTHPYRARTLNRTRTIHTHTCLDFSLLLRSRPRCGVECSLH